ncbi:MAG: glycosyl transferase family 1 [Gammaproteobacteria bacterium]|nr:glycosyl transferase family 1 [Gammaproteobacteria bacterium]
MSKNNVLFLVPKLFCGGVERSVVDIFNHLQHQNPANKVLLAAFYPDGEFAAQVHQPILTPSYPKWLRRLVHKFLLGAKQQASEISFWLEILHIVVASLLLPSLLKQGKPRIIVSFTHHAMFAMWLRKRLLKKHRVHWILVEGSNIVDGIQNGVQNHWLYCRIYRIFKRAYHSADYIIAVSQGLSHALSQAFDLPERRITCIHNPIVQQATALSEQNSPVPPSFPYIIAVGRLVAVKGFDILLQAYAKIAPELAVNLVILGEGPQHEALLQLVHKFNLQQRVLLPGFVPNPRTWMRTAKILILSSKMEGLGNVILEAMAEGTPVVATDCDFGPRDIIQDGYNGRLVPVGDPQALTNAITELLNHPEHSQQYATHALQTLEHFSISRICQEYAALFTQFGVDIKC